MVNTEKNISCLYAEFSNEKWVLKYRKKIITKEGIQEHTGYILTFRKEVKGWKNLEDLLKYVHTNYPALPLEIFTPFGLVLISNGDKP